MGSFKAGLVVDPAQTVSRSMMHRRFLFATALMMLYPVREALEYATRMCSSLLR